MLFLVGVNIWRFATLQGVAIVVMAVLLYSSEYRRVRLISFLDPWADPFNSGFQLIQSLIAIGRGELWGVGLGASVQKLFYLPEAYTDFIFAILAEELGLTGVVFVIGLYAIIVWRAFSIAARAEWLDMVFIASLAYGIGLWFGVQALFNMGVTMGVLPTKGLTLPLVSYGGSSVVVMCMALAILLRSDMETRRADPRLRPRIPAGPPKAKETFQKGQRDESCGTGDDYGGRNGRSRFPGVSRRQATADRGYTCNLAGYPARFGGKTSASSWNFHRVDWSRGFAGRWFETPIYSPGDDG
jgi:hypothetical protein